MTCFLSSTIGKKVVVAVTGLIMFGFLIGHMAGNLLIFAGPQMFNHYAAAIKANPPLLWGTRFTLLTSVILHIVFTIQLVLHNKASRPIPYTSYTVQKAKWGSTFMAGTGIFLAVYIVYHIFHFTLGTLHPAFNQHDVYANVVSGFRVVWTSIFYILAMVAAGFHLNHGVQSLFQTLGLNHPKYNCARTVLASLVAIVIPAGFISIPIAVLTGFVR